MNLNKIIRGNSLEILKTLPDKSVDVIFADPPYNLQLQKDLYRNDGKKFNGVNDQWDKFSSFEEYDNFLSDWILESRRILKDNGTIWVIGSFQNIFRVGKIIQDVGFWILNDVLWIKSNPVPNFKGTRFNNAHETLIWASKCKDSKFTFNYKTMKICNEDKQMRSDWYIPIVNGKERLKNKFGEKIHSTQKPEELLKRIILSSTKEGDVILDPFFGSGTTGAVAKELRRNFIGIERENKYIKAAEKRIKNTVPIKKDLLFLDMEVKKPKVAFSCLIDKKFIKIGQKLYSKDKKINAIVKADSSLKNQFGVGSIHSLSAKILEKESSNGWKFWYVKKAKKFLLIDELRDDYIRKYFK